ncbi:MAG: PEP-CTERM sorting domain-containing protein [Verrucomicrobia bacterium]|nr:PEP-CTERM sorting domain-containing protein [Verrucomicrobiota bacterium]
MNKVSLSSLALAGIFSIASIHAAEFADSVVAYTPGALTGSAVSHTNASVALGEPSHVTPGQFGGPIDPFNSPYLASQLLSVGAGGSLTVRFNSPIQNDPSHRFGIDFMIFGNAGFTITNGDFSGGGITDGSLFGQNNGATRVSVSSDGQNYFTLNPALTPIVDAMFPTDGNGDFGQAVDPNLRPSDFSGKDLANIRALYGDSGGGAGFDLAWAQDANGQPVTLGNISFVRVDVLSGKSEIDGFAAVDAIMAVPEPSTLALALLGAVGLFVARRQKS